MALYCYIKAKPKYIKVRTVHTRPSSGGLSAKTFISTTLGFAGIFLIIWVAYPIVSFEITSRVKYKNVADAIPPEKLAESRKGQSVPHAEVLAESTSPDEDTTQIDYTKASNWFPKQPQGQMNLAGRIYFLTIPKLRVFDATVKIAGESLDKSLIHYGGTGLPGDYGTSVIFGHSILPQFYDPKNYKAIFSLLPKLKEGDEIFAKFDGITYRYVVMSMRVTTPDDVTVLEQRYDTSYITLITCVPPGTYWKRLEVRARLEPI